MVELGDLGGTLSLLSGQLVVQVTDLRVVLPQLILVGLLGLLLLLLLLPVALDLDLI